MTSSGQRVDLWRRHRGFTLRALAEATGLHLSSLHRIIHGQQQAKADELEAIATALDLTMPDFYGDLPDVAEAS